MSPNLVALTLISLIVGIGACVGFYARKHHKMNLEQWTVAGRGFGVVLVWLLMAGETYTTFTFLGASGWAYSRGGPALFILGYQSLMYVVAFFLLPALWQAGRDHGLQTQADFFHLRYGSKYLAALVALLGVLCIVPYLQLQLTGLGIIVEVASSGAIHGAIAMIIAFVLVAGFVFASGIRGVAWVSVIKDVLLLFAAVFVGIAIPYVYFGGIGPMFAAVMRAKPTHLVMPGATANLGHAWYATSVLLASFGFFMWPQFFGACFTAKSGDVLRRNAVVMPLYSITMPLMFFVGLTALLVLPGLSSGDLSMLMMVRRTFPAWFLGIVGGAGALTAMVPAAILLLTASTLFAKNLCRSILAPEMTDSQVAKLAKITVLVVTAAAVCSAIYSSTTLVSLLLLGYAGVAQFLPGVMFGLYSRRMTTFPILAGLLSGTLLASFLMLSKRDPFMSLNAGFVGLCVNFALVGIVHLLAGWHRGNSNRQSTAATPAQSSVAIR
jgi:SSS family solute:Na+ symporter